MNAFLEQIAVALAGEAQTAAAPSTASPDYGSDWACAEDCDAWFTELAGDDPRLVAEYAYRGITAPRGSIPGAEDEGISLREFLRKPATPAEISTWPGRVKAEIMRDDRVADCTVTFTEQSSGVWTVAIHGETAREPFDLTAVLTADGATLKEILT